MTRGLKELLEEQLTLSTEQGEFLVEDPRVSPSVVTIAADPPILESVGNNMPSAEVSASPPQSLIDSIAESDVPDTGPTTSNSSPLRS